MYSNRIAQVTTDEDSFGMSIGISIQIGKKIIALLQDFATITIFCKYKVARELRGLFNILKSQ